MRKTQIVVAGRKNDTNPGFTGDFVLVRYLADGTLDSSFGTGGWTTTDFGGNIDTALSLAIQPDGKFVAAGVSAYPFNGGTSDFALARYLPNGTLDTSFGTGGQITTDFDTNDAATVVAVQANGMIVAAGTAKPSSSANPNRFAVARYTAVGVLDSTFGTGGKVATAFPGLSANANSLQLQAGGTVLVAGASATSSTAPCAGGVVELARYTSTGSLDASFGTGGLVTTDFGPFNYAGACALAAQADGSLIVAGTYSSTRIASERFFQAHYLANGTFDTTFGASGLLVGTFYLSQAGATSLALQPDGKIVVAGSDSTGGFTVARYLPGGSLDAAFGTGGVVTTTFATGTATAAALTIQSDGKIVVVGDAPVDAFGPPAFALARYMPNGTLDPAFGTNGQVLTNPDPATYRMEAYAVTMQPDGKMVVAGTTALQGVVVGRYLADGTLDSSFGYQGLAIQYFSDTTAKLQALAVQPDGKIVAGGDTGNSCAQACVSDFLVMRYLADGTADPSFGTNGMVRTGVVPNTEDSITGIVLQPDGQIVATGILLNDACTPSCGLSDIGLVRYLADGTVDPSFGSGGRVITDLGAYDSVRGVVLQSDGKIVIGGASAGAASYNQFTVARYTSAGALDSGFGSGGITRPVIAPLGSGATGLALDTDGNMVVAGSARLDTDHAVFALARYRASGGPDPTATVTGTATPTGTTTPLPTATATTCPVTFSDVPAGSTFYDHIQCLACRGIVGGYSDGSFRPNAAVTRGQMAKFIANAAGYSDPIPPTQQTFSDVPPTDTFWIYIERAAAHGIVGGYSDGTYRPVNPVTRGQMAKFISMASGYHDTIPPTQQTFSDVPPTDTFWVYVERVVVHGIVGGYSDGTYRPTSAVTRGQTAKFIGNAFFPGCLGNGHK